MSHCMQASELLTKLGPRNIVEAVELAVESCRRDIECECTRIDTAPGQAPWWDTENALFSGPCDNDLEFRAMRARSLAFLSAADAIERHPEHPTWVRFKAATTH